VSGDGYAIHEIRAVISRGDGGFHAPAPAAREVRPQPRVPASLARRRSEAKRALAEATAALDDLRDGDLTPGLADQVGDLIASAENVLGRYGR
jgi:hypothetical protein